MPLRLLLLTSILFTSGCPALFGFRGEDDDHDEIGDACFEAYERCLDAGIAPEHCDTRLDGCLDADDQSDGDDVQADDPPTADGRDTGEPPPPTADSCEQLGEECLALGLDEAFCGEQVDACLAARRDAACGELLDACFDLGLDEAFCNAVYADCQAE